MNIEYKEINYEMLIKISKDFDSEWIKKYVNLGKGAFGLSAMDGDVYVGYVIVTPRALTYPLEHLKDAFIDIIEVRDDYQRQGIGQNLIMRSEEWEKSRLQTNQNT